jgi:hypothetical protein
MHLSELDDHGPYPAIYEDQKADEERKEYEAEGVVQVNRYRHLPAQQNLL